MSQPLSPEEICALWEQFHGTLHPHQRQAFAARPEISDFQKLSDNAIALAFKREQRLADALPVAQRAHQNLRRPPDDPPRSLARPKRPRPSGPAPAAAKKRPKNRRSGGGLLGRGTEQPGRLARGWGERPTQSTGPRRMCPACDAPEENCRCR